MKAKERHDLKKNEFAASTARMLDVAREQGSRLTIVGIAVVVVLAIGGGLLYSFNAKANKAGALLGVALATSQAQIAPPSTLPGAKQMEGTYPTAAARSEAALKAYQAVVAEYPSSDAALTATYESAGELLSLGRTAEAEAEYNKVVASGSKVYAPMATLGLARVKQAAGKYDDAIKLLTDLAAQRDETLPVDGVLMQLADAYTKAGKADDARATYKRVVDEFGQSVYVTDARQRLAVLN